MNDAEKLLTEGDYPQASEKLWGAVAQMIKTIAASHRWRHSSHRDLRGAIGRLYEQSGDRELPRLFSVAESLHANYCEDYMEPNIVRLHADDVRNLIEKLQPFAN